MIEAPKAYATVHGRKLREPLCVTAQALDIKGNRAYRRAETRYQNHKEKMARKYPLGFNYDAIPTRTQKAHVFFAGFEALAAKKKPKQQIQFKDHA